MKNERRDYNFNRKFILTAILLVLVFGVGYFMISSSKIKVESQYLKISGFYKETVDYKDIKVLELKDELPNSFVRTNGIDFFGIAYVGKFKGENMDKINVSVHSKNPPYVFLQTNSGSYLIFNSKNKKATEELYNTIKENLQDNCFNIYFNNIYRLNAGLVLY